MKSASIIFTLLLSVFIAQAQITILSADMPSANDTLRFSNADLNLIDSVENTGTNYFWDFSNLKPLSQDVTEYKAASNTPYAFYFIGASKFGVKITDSLNLGIVNLYDIYDFFQNTSAAFVTEGRGIKYSGFPIGSYYSDKDEIYQFPLEFNDNDSSTFRYKMDLATLASLTTTGYRINEVDGWGKIKTPYGTFNCLRVKSKIVSNDTIVIAGFPIGMPSTTIEYKWLAKGEKLPILEVIGTDGMMGFTVSAIKFRDIYREVYDPNAPVTDFTADNINPTTVDVVSFTNNTSDAGILPAYAWTFTPNNVTFEDGTDAGSEEPKVIFTKAGKYSVQLAVSNFNGGTHDTSKIDYITVIDAKTLAPVSDFSANTLTPKINGWIFITNNTKNKDNSTFEWSFFPDKATYLDGTDNSSKDPVISFSEGGYYNALLKSTNKYGVHDTTKMNYFYVSGAASVETAEHLSKIYPNPVTDYLNIELNNDADISVRILNSLGQVVYSNKFISNKHIQINTSELQKGIYTLEITKLNVKSYHQFMK